MGFCLPCDEHVTSLRWYHNSTAYSLVPGGPGGGVFDVVGRLLGTVLLLVGRPFAERLRLLLRAHTAHGAAAGGETAEHEGCGAKRKTHLDITCNSPSSPSY